MANDIATTGRFDLVAADKTLAAAKPEDMQDLHRACSDLQNARLDNLPARIEHAEAVLRRVEPIAALARKAMEPASDRMLQAHLAGARRRIPKRAEGRHRTLRARTRDGRCRRKAKRARPRPNMPQAPPHLPIRPNHQRGARSVGGGGA